MGAALAVPLALTIDSAVTESVFVLALIGIGLWAAKPFSAGDPGWVVVDETAGAWLGVIGLGGWPFVFGWLVTRVADITKLPPGVRQAEQLPGAWGVMADDLVAGVYGLVAGWLITSL